MLVTAELVGGPIDGSQFTVPEPPPYEWRRHPTPPMVGQALVIAPELVDGFASNPAEFERYLRDEKPRNDGVWCYRWQGRARG